MVAQYNQDQPPPNGQKTPAQHVSEDRTHRDLLTLLPQRISGFLRDIPRFYRWPVAILALLVCGICILWSAMPDGIKETMLTWAWHRVDAWVPSPNRVGYYPGVAVEHEQIVVDFSHWSAPHRKDDLMCCKTVWRHTLKVRRVDDEANYIAKRVATSGGEPKIHSSSHNDFEIIPVQGQRTSGTNISRYDVIFDVSSEGLHEEFDLAFTVERLGGFSDDENEWAAVPIMQPTRQMVLKLQFSPDKLPNNLNYRMSTRAERDNYSDLPNQTPPGRCSADTLLEWTIDHPQLGYEYRVDWAW